MPDQFVTHYSVQIYTVTVELQRKGAVKLECNCAQGGLCVHELDVLQGKASPPGDPYLPDVFRYLPSSIVSAFSAYANANSSFERAQLKDQMEKELVEAGVVPARFVRPSPESGPDDVEN